MENCSSGYQPSNIVESFHNIPHVDVDLGEINSTFEQTVEEYFEAIIVWSCLPVLFGIIMVILFFLFWGLLWAYEYCTRADSYPKTYRKPSSCVKVSLVCSLLFLSLIGIVFCGGSYYAEIELDKDIDGIGDVASSAEEVIDSIGSLASSYNHTGVIEELDSLRAQLSRTGRVPLVIILQGKTLPLNYLYGNISLIAQGYHLNNGADDVENFELPRNVVVLIFVSLVAILFMVFFVIILTRSTFYITSVAVVVFIFMLLMWCASGAALGAVIVASDVCFNPDETILIQISTSEQRGITEYYMFCNGVCNNQNTLTEKIEELQVAQEMVDESYDTLCESTQSISNDTIRDTVEETLDRLKGFLDNSTARSLDELTNCTALSEEYSRIRDEFCDEGVIYTLVLFCTSTAMAFLYYIMLCLTKKYVNMLYASERWGKDGLAFPLSSTPELQNNGYSNGSGDTHRQVSVRRKQQYDGGWVAGKTHQGNYKHRGSSSEYELQGQLPEYSDVLDH